MLGYIVTSLMIDVNMDQSEDSAFTISADSTVHPAIWLVQRTYIVKESPAFISIRI